MLHHLLQSLRSRWRLVLAKCIVELVGISAEFRIVDEGAQIVQSIAARIQNGLALPNVNNLLLHVRFHLFGQLPIIPLFLLECSSHGFEARAELFEICSNDSQFLLRLLKLTSRVIWYQTVVSAVVASICCRCWDSSARRRILLSKCWLAELLHGSTCHCLCELATRS